MDRLPIVTEMGELSMETYVLSIASYSLCSVMACNGRIDQRSVLE